MITLLYLYRPKALIASMFVSLSIMKNDDPPEVYQRVYVLELDWEEESPLNHDLRSEIATELAELVPELQYYNFNVLRLRIPTKEPISVLKRYLTEFYRLIGSTSGAAGGSPLIILYYNGHGGYEPAESWNQKYTIAGAKEVQWELLHEAFVRHSMYDHLILMHSCFAANAVPFLSHTNLPPDLLPHYASLHEAVNRENQLTRLHIICGADQNHYAWGGPSGLTMRLYRALIHLKNHTFTIAELSTQMEIETTVMPPLHALPTPPRKQRLVHHPVSQLARNGPHRKIGRLSKPPEEFSRTNIVGKLQLPRTK
jgi:hypothetical protein